MAGKKGRGRVSSKAGERAARPSPERTVLVVDSDPELEAVVRVLKRRKGFEYWLSSEVSQAAELLKEKKPSVVIVNIDTVEDALEFVRSLRNRGVRVVVLSGSGDVLQAGELYDCGITDHIILPRVMSEIRRRELVAEAVDNALSRRRRRRVAENDLRTLYRWTAEKNTKFMLVLEEQDGQRKVYLKPGLWRRWNIPSFCIGVQSGCRMGCKFCANRIERPINLTPEQIVQQVDFSLNQTEFPMEEDEEFRLSFTNVGEPFAGRRTYQNVWRAIEILLLEKSYRHRIIDIKISTVGRIQGIQWLQEDLTRLKGGTEEEQEAAAKIILQVPATYLSFRLREEMMPASARFTRLLRAAREFARATESLVIVNHVLIGGPGRLKNDTAAIARDLARRIKWVGGNDYDDYFEVQTTNLLVTGSRELMESRAGEDEGAVVFAATLREEGIQHKHMRVPPRLIQGIPGLEI